jgi:hypothetical protein
MSDSFSGLRTAIDYWSQLADKTARRARSAVGSAEKGTYDVRKAARDAVGFYDDTIGLTKAIDYWRDVGEKATRRARDAIHDAERGRYDAGKLARDVIGVYGDVIPLTMVVGSWGELAAKATRRARGALETAERGDLTVEKIVRGIFGLYDDAMSASFSLCEKLGANPDTIPIGASGIPRLTIGVPYGQDTASGNLALGLTPGTALTCDDLKHVGLPAAIQVDKSNIFASVPSSGDLHVDIQALNGVVVAGADYRGQVRDKGTPIVEIVLSVGK